MKKFRHAFAMLSLIAALALIAYPLYAHCGKCAADGKKIAAQLDQNKTTLAKAVTAAETHSKGRSISVISAIDDKGQIGVHVYSIVGEPPKIMKCNFDLKTGTVTGMKEVQSFPVVDEEHARDHEADHKHGKHEGGKHEDDHATVMMITNKTVDAGCGACIYKMTGVTGCPLAVTIDGKHYLVEGATWPNHDYCDRNCQAVVTGKIEGDKFIATSLTAK